ncbi:MAG: hypothetical protein R3215_17580 [Halomonas sp.]|nr:hypothetical protein [Halomonas sp.]
MKHWRLVLRMASACEAPQDTRVLKRDIETFMRVAEIYEVTCLGIRLLGVDFLADDHEFGHIMRLVKILEARYRLSILQFSELKDESGPGMTVKIGSKPAAIVA